jgi:hypothetical protein
VNSLNRRLSKTLLQTLVLLAILTLTGTGQGQDIRINRLEIQAPWTGFYVGQGVQLWGKAVIHNSSNVPLGGATVQFDFFDPVGPRESFKQPLPVLQAGGTVSVESPQWWDYSGAQIGMKVTVLGKTAGSPLAEKTMERQQ